MANISKSGIISLILGVILILGVWLTSFQQTGIMMMLAATFLGGLVLLGLFLIVLGLLILFI